MATSDQEVGGRMVPTVSVLIPSLDERKYITDCLASIENQDYPQVCEILVIDGGSVDGTREIVDSWGGKVHLVDNPGVTAASAMNIGLSVAKGEIVVRIDAHSNYESDYCSRSVAVLLETGAAVVGGPMRPRGDTKFGQAVAIATTTPIGIGNGKFHYADKRCEVETVYLGTFRPETVTQVGGYDDRNLQWAAEDQELNYRIRKAGGKIVLDPSIRSTYIPRGNIRSLARQYHNYGLCKMSTLVKHRTLPYWRPLAPAALVFGCLACFIVCAVLSLFLLAIAPILIYLMLLGTATLFLVKQKTSMWLNTFIALVVIHWSYGLGFLRGIGRALLGRQFESRPQKRRV